MSKKILNSIISFKFLSQLCGIIAAALGILAIMGWLMGWRTLSSIRADYIPMAPNTALSFIVLGISLCALITEKKQGLKLSKIGATVIFVLSLIRFAEFSVNINLNVDRWIFQAPSEKLGLIPVGQMALPTTINFLFASAALFLASSLKKHWIMGGAERLLSVATTLIGLAFSLGYIYSAPLLYGGTTIPMVLNTAIAFFVLGMGLVINNQSHDVAERKRAAEALRKAHDELEVRVAERTAELVQVNEELRAEIIERRHAEEALQESENKFRDLSEKSIVGVYLIQDGVFKYANPKLAEIFGYTIDELIDKRGPEDLVLPEDWPIVEENLRKRISGEIESINYDFRGITKNKETIYVEVYGTRTTYGGRPAVIGTLLDITVRKKAEAVRAFLANITEHATDAIEGIDLDTNIVSWNSGAETLFGYSAHEVIGRPHSFIVPKEAQEACRERFKKATLEGSVRAETERIKKDGRRFPVEMTLTALKDEKAEHTGFVCITRDITERKKLEEQLRQAQKLEAIGQLAGGVAHDFNNILSGIIGFGSLVEMNMKEDDPNRAHLKEILKAGERAAQLTKSLLAFSRKQIIDLKPQNLNEIIKGVESFLRRIIGEDIELKAILTPPPSAPPLKIRGGRGSYVSEEEIGDLTVLADRGQIEQVLMNLAANARDALPNGGDLIIETKQVGLDVEFIKRHGYGEAGIYALLTVTDSGTGMDEKTRERIFEPFFTTKELGRGTGLGLAMVYGIIKQHDGFINVYSEPEKGTTFKIYLPLIKSAVEESVGATPAAYPKGGTETVLVAEDDQAVRKLTMNVLERFGYKVIAAEDGEEAIKKFKENKKEIQLLLLDVIMPKKNGKEVYEEIKKINPRIKTIFLSGYTANLIHKKGILEEGLNFMLKPVSPKELLKKVRETLDR